MGVPRKRWTWRSAAVAQSALAAVALLTLAFAPPVHGRTLLVPVSGNEVAPALLDQLGLTPVAGGPFAGSMLVEGIGRAHAGVLFDQGILMLAAPAALCSAPSPSEGDAR